MLVKAKCITPAWDNVNAIRYEPGWGPLAEGLYEIDRNGPLASLKVGDRYVFEFDRNGTRTNDGVDVVKDYSCKREGCGKKFKTLNALGTHTREDHKDEPVIDEEPAGPVVDGRGKKKNKTFTCHTPGCGALLPNLYALKLHKQEHKAEAQTPAA